MDATRSTFEVVLTFDSTANGAPLTTPEEIAFSVDEELARTIAWAQRIGEARTDRYPVSFSSLLLAMAVGTSAASRWLAAFLHARKVGRDELVGLESKRERHEAMLAALERPPEPSTRPEPSRASISARQALEATQAFRDGWGGGGPIEVRHLVAAFATIPHYHDSEFTRLRVGRRHWVRELAAAQLVAHPEEAEIWRDYVAKSLVPEPALSPDVYTSEDLLDIDSEVDALGQLIVSAHTVTPLSLGIFGPWGSGKSFFMRHLRRRVAALANLARPRNLRWLGDRTALAPESFHLIAQVEFNAWHYNQGNVIASLVDRIFSSLTPDLSGSKSERQAADVAAELEEHKRALEAVLLDATATESLRSRATSAAEAREATAQARLAAAVEQERSAVVRVEAATRGLATASEGREAIQRRLGDVRKKIAKRKPGLGELRRVLLGELAKTPVAEAARGALDETERAAREGSDLVALLTSWRGVLGLGVIAGAVALASLSDALGSRIGAVVAALGAFTVAMRQVREVLASARAKWEAAAKRIDEANARAMSEHLQRIEDRVRPLLAEADADVEAAKSGLEAAQSELVARSDARDEAATELSNAATALASASQAQAESRDEVERTRAELAATTAGWLLDAFLKDRLRTEDYKKELGFMGLVRRDFERLDELIAASNREFLSADANAKQPALQRIVLYIDDLDRCKEETVVEVLQAVHLLLAFPLFVCVVAVDPRWVGRCLHRRFPELLAERLVAAPDDDGKRGSNDVGHDGGTRGDDAQAPLIVPATVADYLEKIFQIPIWMSPVPPPKRASIVQALLLPPRGAASGASSPSRRQDDPRAPPPPPPAPRPAVVPKRTGVRAGQLLIRKEESDFVGELGPLLSDRPRILKRFVNTYRLLKASLPDEDFDGFVGDSVESPHRICLVELALLLGASPHEAREILAAVRSAPPDAAIGETLKGLSGVPDPAVPAAMAKVAVERFRKWTERTSRYLFLR